MYVAITASNAHCYLMETVNTFCSKLADLHDDTRDMTSPRAAVGSCSAGMLCCAERTCAAAGAKNKAGLTTHVKRWP